MPRKRSKKKDGAPDVATENFRAGYKLIDQHPMFAPMLSRAWVIRHDNNLCPDDGWAVVTIDGELHVHPKRRATPEEWVYVLAHCLLHLGFTHFRKYENTQEWNAACDCIIAKFLSDLKLGRPPEELSYRIEFSARNEERLYQQFCERGIPPELQDYRRSFDLPASGHSRGRGGCRDSGDLRESDGGPG